VSEEIIEKILEETLKKVRVFVPKGKKRARKTKGLQKGYQVLHRKVLLLSISLRHFQKNLK